MPLGPAPLDAPLPAPTPARAQTAVTLEAGARELFSDARGTGMRVSWHPERGVVVLSTWKRDVCTGTFHLPLDEAPRLAEFLAAAGEIDAGGPTAGAVGDPLAAGATGPDHTPRAVDDRTVPLQVLRGDRRR